MNGNGCLSFPNGHKIIAKFQKGGIIGDVILEYKNGDVYKGRIAKGKENGFGVY